MKPFSLRFAELLSSMRFAISLLTLIAIASVIGTVLKQNEPYANYLNQFGPFWFRVFEAAGLYAVYNAPWFEDVMYKAIALGFAFFTVATILGALWAAEAWGSYWQWDPKETWALIVWLNYAAWLHIRLTKGLRGPLLAWWSLVGLLVTTFAFLGVNMFLSGLHSYGQL